MIQIVRIPADGGRPEVLVGDPDCDRDPCSKHGSCHCMCVCGCDPEDDNCDECAEAFS